jgi:hypothetical protein
MAAEGTPARQEDVLVTTGAQQLVDFFRQVQQEDAQRAQQAKSLLDQR